MKAIVAYGAKDYRFCEVDTPKVGEGEILIKIEAAGICASDRAVYMGGDPWGGIESPRVPGHEFVGTVEEIGPGAEEKGFVRGDRVTAECIMPCGKCYYCKKGLYHLCDDENGFLEGGFAEYMLLPKNALIHKVSKDIPAVEAALCEPLSCSAYAVNQTGMGMEDTVCSSSKSEESNRNRYQRRSLRNRQKARSGRGLKSNEGRRHKKNYGINRRSGLRHIYGGDRKSRFGGNGNELSEKTGNAFYLQRV